MSYHWLDLIYEPSRVLAWVAARDFLPEAFLIECNQLGNVEKTTVKGKGSSARIFKLRKALPKLSNCFPPRDRWFGFSIVSRKCFVSIVFLLALASKHTELPWA